MSEKSFSTLYTAATESLVADASATSTFEKMIAVAFTYTSVEDFVKEVKETEKQIRKDFDISSMPGPWRSAKSVIHTAMKLSIKLIDDNGSYVGKTFLQNKIKELKTPKEELTSEEYANKVIKNLLSVPEGLDAVKVFQIVKDFINAKK